MERDAGQGTGFPNTPPHPYQRTAKKAVNQDRIRETGRYGGVRSGS